MRKIMLLMLLVLCLLLTGCASGIPFDPETEGAVDVIVLNGETAEYYAVSGDGRRQEIAAFEGDAIRIYTPDADAIESYLGENNRGNGAFINRLTDVRLWDENGCAVHNTRLMNEILLAAAELNHDLFNVKLIQAGAEWFVYVELNVNWVAPCDLYWYDQARGGLVEVYSFDNREVIGLRVRDLSRLSARPLYKLDHPGRQTGEVAGIDALLADFAENRDLCTAGMAVLHDHPELFDMLRQERRLALTAPDGTRYTFTNDKRDERFSNADPALFNTVDADADDYWERWRAQFDVDHVPFAYFADKAVLTEAETQQVQAMLDVLNPAYVGQEEAVFLHFAVPDANGQTWVLRLYYAPEADAATAISAAWPVWQDMGGGWYMAALVMPEAGE